MTNGEMLLKVFSLSPRFYTNLSNMKTVDVKFAGEEIYASHTFDRAWWDAEYNGVETKLAEHDAKVRADAIDEFMEAILKDMTFIKPTEEQIKRIAEQIKEQKK